MQKTFYFIAGLPRSGSTLLSSILNQNPRFHSGPSSPVVPTMLALESSLSHDQLFLSYPKPEQAKAIISSVLPQFHGDRKEPVIFDKNRSWPVRLDYIQGYFDIKPKVICPVRGTADILTSFISLVKRNPFQVNGTVNFVDEMLIKMGIPLTDENRCEFLAGPDGILGQSVSGLRKATMEGNQHCLHFVEYDDLVSSPDETLKKIYDFLEEESFPHSFDKIRNDYRERDPEVYGLADMHLVRPTLSKVSQKPEETLPRVILEKCENTEFWRNL